MANISKKPLAESDLIDIWSYIADDNPQKADTFLDTIEKKLQTLAENPYMGRAREELASTLRSFPFGNYVVFYRPIENGIEVIRILSGARDIDTLL